MIKLMRLIVQGLLLFFLNLSSWALVISKDLPDEGMTTKEARHEMDEEVDYEHFTGRMTDRDVRARIIKVRVENNNTKFFRVGDTVEFHVGERLERKACKGHIRQVEDFHFTLFVNDLTTCFEKDEYLKRGSMLVFKSLNLAYRVFEASKYRQILIDKKDGFLRQLNTINNFIWTFDQQKVQVAADYDKQIVELQKAKQRAIDDLIIQKQEKLVLQTELMRQLHELDESLKFYRVERQELLLDRWNDDHDLGLPFAQRPQNLKKE